MLKIKSFDLYSFQSNSVQVQMRYSSYVFIVVICHYFYHLFRYTFLLSDLMTTIILNIFLYEIFFWVPALIFEWMDRDGFSKELKKRFKLTEVESKVTFWDTVISSILNQICQHIVISFLMYLVLRKFDESFISTIFWIFVYYIIHDIVFYFGHLLMHKWKWLYQKVHKKHHQVFASIAASAHYMTWFDFFLESMCEAIFHVLCFPFGASPIAFISFSCAGVFNGVVVHSGYDIPYLPDPKRHYFHHTKYKVNYSIGPLDRMLGTNYEENCE